MMASSVMHSVMNIVIDERFNLSALDTTAFLTMTEAEVAEKKPMQTKRRVFKDYILSSEAFQLDSHLNN